MVTYMKTKHSSKLFAITSANLSENSISTRVGHGSNFLDPTQPDPQEFTSQVQAVGQPSETPKNSKFGRTIFLNRLVTYFASASGFEIAAYNYSYQHYFLRK